MAVHGLLRPFDRAAERVGLAGPHDLLPSADDHERKAALKANLLLDLAYKLLPLNIQPRASRGERILRLEFFTQRDHSRTHMQHRDTRAPVLREQPRLYELAP